MKIQSIKSKILLPIVLASLTMCGQNQPVETENANTNLKPAFVGQTRIGGVKTNTAVKSEVLNTKLGRPWGITELPDGRFLVTEKSGFLNLVSPNGKKVTKVTGLPKVDAAGQGGLLDVIIDNEFDKNRTIYFTFSEPFENGNLTSLAKATLAKNEKSVENVKIIFRATPSYNGKLHYGSRIVIDKDNNLIFSTGERSDKATRPLAQDLNGYLGKIIRITKEGKPAAGNPFIGRSDAKPEIYSYGHRNVQGLALHPETNDLWNSEFGPRGGDELNRVEAGKNYGWPIITYGIEYNGKEIGEHIASKEGLEQPTYYWDPVISPSGMTFYSGNKIAEWKNNLFIACLSGQHIDRLVIEDQKVVGEERLLSTEDERFRDIIETKNGDLVAVTDSGKLYKISKK